MKRKSSKSWYGVRTLVRVLATGQPKVNDKSYDPLSTLVEDRVVLFHAGSHQEAIEKAEAEVRHYCKLSLINLYGQRVRLKYLGVVDSFSMLDHEPVSGCEVFSSTTLVSSTMSDRAVIATRWGNWRGREPESARLKFIDAELIPAALSPIKSAKVRPAKVRP